MQISEENNAICLKLTDLMAEPAKFFLHISKTVSLNWANPHKN